MHLFLGARMRAIGKSDAECAVCVGKLFETQACVGTNCECAFGNGASEQLLGGGVAPSGLYAAPNDKCTRRQASVTA